MLDKIQKKMCLSDFGGPESPDFPADQPISLHSSDPLVLYNLFQRHSGIFVGQQTSQQVDQLDRHRNGEVKRLYISGRAAIFEEGDACGDLIQECS